MSWNFDLPCFFQRKVDSILLPQAQCELTESKSLFGHRTPKKCGSRNKGETFRCKKVTLNVLNVLQLYQSIFTITSISLPGLCEGGGAWA